MIKNLLILLILFTGKSFAYFNEEISLREYCEKENGVWREFGNSCADTCYFDRGYDRSCFSNVAFSCDCLKDRCWSDNKCVKNEVYQYNEKINEDHRLKKMEQENPELFLDKEVLVKLDRKRNANKNNPQGLDASGQGGSSSGGKSKKKDTKILSKTELISACGSSQGIWKKFSTSCADDCNQKTSGAICNAKTTESCECGREKCWNGSKCIDN